MSSGRASRAKGKRGELESAAVFKRHGFDVRPLQSGQASRDDAGDYLASIAGVTLVVDSKRRQRVRVVEWAEALEPVARAGETPAVVFRQDAPGPFAQGPPWRIVLGLEAFCQLLELAAGAIERVP